MTLAIEGGNPVRNKPFNPWPYYDDNEKKALVRALEQGQWWRMSGEEVNRFEHEFAEYHGADSAIATTNGTHALEVALLTLGIGAGDEVIVPAFTFLSTSLAVQRVGAVPIPVDIDPNTYCITPEIAEKEITSKTRAIIPVHMAGHMVDMNRLSELAERKNIVIIQDAAHAHGAVRDNRRIGEWNSIACFSFQNFKLMTAGEGGAMTFPTRELRDKAFLFHNCGRPLGDREYRHHVLGSNYRLNEFSAAILREQLQRLQSQNARREENARYLFSRLRQIEKIILQQREETVNIHPHYMVMLRMDTRYFENCNVDYIVRALVAEGLPAYLNYRPIYHTDAFWQHPSPHGDSAYWASKCPSSERLFKEGIWIHHRVLLGTTKDVDDVVDAIDKVVMQH